MDIKGTKDKCTKEKRNFNEEKKSSNWKGIKFESSDH